MDADLFQQIQFEDSDNPGSFGRAIKTQIVDWQTRTIGTQLDLSALYSCRVVGQSADLATLDVTLDSPRLKARGMQRVPIRYGLPGIKAVIRAGAIARVGWDNTDPSLPYVAIFNFDGIASVDLDRGQRRRGEHRSLRHLDAWAGLPRL